MKRLYDEPPLEILQESASRELSWQLNSFFQVVRDGVRRGTVLKLFKKRYRLDVGKFKFASRFVRSGTGWGMELSLQGQWMFLRRGLIIT